MKALYFEDMAKEIRLNAEFWMSLIFETKILKALSTQVHI